jgi:hypothetical protein
MLVVCWMHFRLGFTVNALHLDARRPQAAGTAPVKYVSRNPQIGVVFSEYVTPV